jgi:hypothetical protein
MLFKHRLALRDGDAAPFVNHPKHDLVFRRRQLDDDVRAMRSVLIGIVDQVVDHRVASNQRLALAAHQFDPLPAVGGGVGCSARVSRMR